MPRKRRTRQHVIADLSANHFERHALLCGFSIERIQHDYGVDLELYSYNEDGEIENDLVYIQLKATDRLNVLANRQTVFYSIQRSDLELWLLEVMPIILVLYDAQSDVAYWIYVQAYFNHLAGFDITRAGESVTVHFEKTAIVDEAAVRAFVQYKKRIVRLAREVVYHDYHDS